MHYKLSPISIQRSLSEVVDADSLTKQDISTFTLGKMALLPCQIQNLL